MQINKNKTQILTIYTSHTDCDSYLLDQNGTRIESKTELKMLGFYFSTKPSVQLQIDKLYRKANKRVHLLAKYKQYGVAKDKLRTIYTATIRSVLEYSSNTYHSQLNKGQVNEIERVQKKSLKMIDGYHHSYEELLRLAPLDRMEERKVKLFEKFTQKHRRT